MVFRIVILFFLALAQLNIYAQVEITGSLIGTQGDSLQDHPVFLFDQDGFLKKTTTNESGRYLFLIDTQSDIIIVKTVGFCGFWRTHSDTVFLKADTCLHIDFSICHNITPQACSSKFLVKPESEFEFFFSSQYGYNEFITYQWDFGDGGTSNLAELEYDYEEKGVYNVRLITENPVGCIDTVVQEVLAGRESYVRGNIHTNDNYLSNAFIWLIGFDFNQNNVIKTIRPDPHGRFKFWCEPNSKYLLKLVPDFGDNNYAPRLLPTYLGGEFYWQDADVLDVGHEIKDLRLAVLESDFIPHGFNKIHGYIFNDHIERELPLTVYLLNSFEEPIDFARVKGENFEFENLPAGTYFILPETAGKVSYPLKVVFEGDFDPPVNLEFKVGTTHINPLVGLQELDSANDEVQLSPIPVKNILHIRSTLPLYKIWIYNINGTVIKEKEVMGEKNIELSVQNLKKGTYFIRYLFNNEFIGGDIFLK